LFSLNRFAHFSKLPIQNLASYGRQKGVIATLSHCTAQSPKGSFAKNMLVKRPLSGSECLSKPF
ncbi:hypothetical protein, partial [Enterococcus faecium]|uniref:hypothetical protein n=2 Tax=Enterococcus faecium TaxID=1352 RepID=UPI0022559C45